MPNLRLKMRPLLSFLIIFILGYSLIAECYSSDLKSHLASSGQQTFKGQQFVENQTGPLGNNCDNVYQLSHCHAGHCAFTMTKLYVPSVPIGINQSYTKLLSVYTQGPFLEGPRRPPRT